MDLLWAGIITLLVAVAIAFCNKWFEERMRKNELTETEVDERNNPWGV